MMVVVCDWCLDHSAVTAPVRVELGGFTFDLCPDHAARWKDLSGGVSGTATPRSRTVTAPQAKELPEPEDSVVTPTASGKTRTAGRASKVKGRASKVSGSATRAGKEGKLPRRGKGAVDYKAVRAWANANNIPAPSRGPLSTALVDQFLSSDLNAPAKAPKATFQQA